MHPNDKSLQEISRTEVTPNLERLIRRHASALFFTIGEMTEWENYQNLEAAMCDDSDDCRAIGLSDIDAAGDEADFNANLPKVLEKLFSNPIDESATRIVYRSSSSFCDDDDASSDGTGTGENDSANSIDGCGEFMRAFPIYMSVTSPEDANGEWDVVFDIDVDGGRRELGYLELSPDFVRVTGELDEFAVVFRALELEFRDDDNYGDDSDVDTRFFPATSSGRFVFEAIRYAEDDYALEYSVPSSLVVESARFCSAGSCGASNQPESKVAVQWTESNAPQLSLRLNSRTGQASLAVHLRPMGGEVPALIFGDDAPKFEDDTTPFVFNIGGGSFETSVAGDQADLPSANLAFPEETATLRFGDGILAALRIENGLSCSIAGSDSGVVFRFPSGMTVTAELNGRLIQNRLKDPLPAWTLSETASLHAEPSNGAFEVVATELEALESGQPTGSSRPVLRVTSGHATLASSSSSTRWEMSAGQCIEGSDVPEQNDETHPLELGRIVSCNP